ncbi:MAG: TrmB family transcriptional regulator [Candidatus Hodarchaeota archaeon]
MENNSLESLGLDPLETKVYLAVLDSTGLTAKDLNDILDMSASKLYSALRRLSELGLIMGDEGRPQMFRPRDPALALTALRESIFEDLEARTKPIIDGLTRRFYARAEDGQCLLRAAFSVITDNSKIVSYLSQIFLEAQKEILISAVPVSLVEATADALRKASSKNVKVRIILLKSESEQIEHPERLENLEIYLADWPERIAYLDGVPSRMASVGIDEYRHLGILCSTLQDRRIHLSSFIAPNIIAAMREEILRSRPKERLITSNRSAKADAQQIK